MAVGGEGREITLPDGGATLFPATRVRLTHEQVSHDDSCSPDSTRSTGARFERFRSRRFRRVCSFRVFDSKRDGKRVITNNRVV